MIVLWDLSVWKLCLWLKHLEISEVFQSPMPQIIDHALFLLVDWVRFARKSYWLVWVEIYWLLEVGWNRFILLGFAKWLFGDKFTVFRSYQPSFHRLIRVVFRAAINSPLALLVVSVRRKLPLAFELVAINTLNPQNIANSRDDGHIL